MTDPRTQELAKRLLEDDPSQWPASLATLQVEKRRMPAALRAKLDAMAQESPRGKVIHRAWWGRPTGLAAAAAVILGISVALGVLLSRRTDSFSHAVLSFVSGSVRVNGTEGKVEQRIQDGAQVSVGPRSTAVLSVKRPAASAEIRIQAGSDVSSIKIGTEHLVFVLLRGAVLASLTRKDSSSSGEKPDLLAVRTGIAEASVRGTRFSIESESGKETRLTTFDGVVTFRRRWAELEDLPSSLLDQVAFLSQIRGIFLEASSSVPAGSESVVENVDFKERTRGMARLETVLALPEISALRGRSTASEAEIMAAKKAIEEAIPSPEERMAIVQAARLSFGQPPVVTSVSDEALEDKQARLLELSDEERDARYAKLLAGRSDSGTFKKEAEKTLGKKPQEIRLKNGEKLFGSVFGIDGRYKVYTATGIRMIDPSEIEEIRFE